MTIAEFLLARITEDEAAADRGRRHNDTGVYANDNYGCLLVDPARVLAECEAKRRIIETVREWDETTEPYSPDYWQAPMGAVLAALALPYADHPDCDPNWIA